MDIAALSMAMSQQNVGLQVGIAVTKLSMDSSDQNMQFMTDMLKTMELSIQPHVGGSIDIKL